jgi:transcriptional regulator with XRE-family HTH domain
MRVKSRPMKTTQRQKAPPSKWAVRLRTIRQRRGLSQAALGELVGCEHSAISQYEVGFRAPPLLVAAKLAHWSGGEIPATAWVEGELAAFAEKCERAEGLARG